jgi:RNA polymerase sigma-B factor
MACRRDQAFEALVLEHGRLARRLARRYARTAEQREDLEQVAYLGLVKAARRYDPSRAVAFTTFAVPTILGELRRFCRDTRWAVHVPRLMQERVQALRRIEDAHQAALGRSPSTAEAAKALDWSEEDVNTARIAAGCLSLQSLNTTLRTADGTVGEVIETIGAEDTAFADADRRDELECALARLTEQERHVLRLRGEAGCSTREIASRMSLTPPQASRLVTRATRRLRAALDGDGLARAPRETPSVALADVDPELVAGVPSDVRSQAVGRRMMLPLGRWRGPRDEPDVLGLLVLSGVLLRTVTVDGRPRTELIGPGDAISRDEDASWQVVRPAELAALSASLGRWPPVVDVLARRAADRAHALAVQLAITDLRRAEDRVLCLLRALGDRWGRRVPDGIAISVPLTHDMVATLAGLHRLSVTNALRRLELGGSVRRTARDRWLVAETGRSELRLAA